MWVYQEYSVTAVIGYILNNVVLKNCFAMSKTSLSTDKTPHYIWFDCNDFLVRSKRNGGNGDGRVFTRFPCRLTILEIFSGLFHFFPNLFNIRQLKLQSARLNATLSLKAYV